MWPFQFVGERTDIALLNQNHFMMSRNNVCLATIVLLKYSEILLNHQSLEESFQRYFLHFVRIGVQNVDDCNEGKL